MDTIDACLHKYNYKKIEILKNNLPRNGVFKVMKNNMYYVAKISRGIDSLNTEISGHKYITTKINQPLYVKYVDDYVCGQYQILIIEYIKGQLLSCYFQPPPVPTMYSCKKFFSETKSVVWWLNIICQLAIAIYYLEKNKITCNDLWEENIILQKIDRGTKLNFRLNNDTVVGITNMGVMVKIFDLGFIHQYKANSDVQCFCMGNKHKKLRWEMGITKTFKLGKDLNNVLGRLAYHGRVPNEIRKWLKSIIYDRWDNKDDKWDGKKPVNRFAILKENMNTSANILLQGFKLILRTPQKKKYAPFLESDVLYFETTFDKEKDALDNYISCITERRLTIEKALKITSDYIVIVAKDHSTKYTLKLTQKGSVYQYQVLQTEKHAYDYFKSNHSPFFGDHGAELLECENGIIMLKIPYIEGVPLTHIPKKSYKFWLNIIIQLICASYFLESEKILHNDYHPGNIIVTKISKNSKIMVKSKNQDIELPNIG